MAVFYDGCCTVCGGPFEHLGYCPICDGSRSSPSSPSSSSSSQKLQYKKIANGHYLVAYEGDDIDKSHWHVAPDGTVLSIKEGGSHRYQRHHVREQISQITGVSLSRLWGQ